MLTQLEKENHQQALYFYQLCLEHFRCVLAGGCSRDILMGNAPKDYDLWMLQEESIQCMLDLLKEVHADASSVHLSVWEILDSEANYNGQVERRDLEYVIRVKFGEVHFDIIKLIPGGDDGDCATEVMQVLESFDFPINQFATLPDGNIIGIGHLRKDQHANRKLRDERIQYLSGKFPEFNFIPVH